MKSRRVWGIFLLAAVAIAPAVFAFQGSEMQTSGNSALPSRPTESTANPTSRLNRVSHIGGIDVVKAKDGLNVEIKSDRPITGNVMRLSHPDRIVVDIPGSILLGASRRINVNNGDVQDIRAAHYKDAPPATRVVIDMAAMHEFELVPGEHTLILKLRNADVASRDKSASSQAVAVVPPASAQPGKGPVASEDKTAAPVVEPLVAKVDAKTDSASTDDRITVNVLGPQLRPVVLNEKKADAPMPSVQAKSDDAVAHFIKPAPPALVSANYPPVSGSAGLSADPALVNAALQQQQQTPAPAAATTTSCTSGHYTGAPLSLDLKDIDIKDFFRLEHELSGLNIILDPGVKGIVSLDVTDIPWDQALALVLRNNGLECELEGNVLRVATLETLRAEADARRAQQEAQALAVARENHVRILSYAHSKDVMTIVKKFLSPRGDVVSDDRSNSVIIEDIPAVMPKIDALLTALDRKTPEVEIEARVVSAQRDFARAVGTQLGFGWGNGVSAAGGGTGVPDPIQTGATKVPFITIPGQAGQIPLFSNLGAVAPTSGLSLINSASSYRLDFTLTLAESRGLVKVLSRPRIVCQNNIATTIRQGQQIPVVTMAQLGGPPSVTYINAFLRLTVTPQITSENTIFLLLDVENTTANFDHVTAAQLNPVLNTQQATTQVLVSDGQTVVIGGVIQTTNNVAINQVPLLGNIPILGNLFKSNSVTTTTAELLFFVTPKIIQT
jgi:type IV pilus assembly protein PilQ